MHSSIGPRPVVPGPPIGGPASTHAATPGDPSDATRASSVGDEAPPERSATTKFLTTTALVGGIAKGLLIDRTRVLAAFSHAREHGKTAKWAAELVSGRITNDVVPITGGTLRVAGRTLTTNGWQRSYQVSNAIGLALLGVGMIYGFPNLVEGWNDGGHTIGGLAETKHGRTGVLGTAGNLFALGVLGTAFATSPAGPGRIAATLGSPLMSNGKVILAGIAMGIPVALNEIGFFDFLNAGDDRDPWTTAKDTVAGHIETVRDLLPGGD